MALRVRTRLLFLTFMSYAISGVVMGTVVTSKSEDSGCPCSFVCMKSNSHLTLSTSCASVTPSPARSVCCFMPLRIAVIDMPFIAHTMPRRDRSVGYPCTPRRHLHIHFGFCLSQWTRSFATQDVLVPWHLADHHSKEPHSNGEGGDGCGQRTEPSDGMANAAAEVAQGPMSASSRGSNGLLTSFREDTTTPESVSSTTNTSYSGRRESWGAGQKPAIGCGIEAEGSPPHEEPGNTCTTDKSAKDISPPTPDVPKHGVRLDGVAGASGSVVYQRYCHVYAEGELEELVKQVHGLRLVESYYDRSNWCIVAQKEGKQGR